MVLRSRCLVLWLSSVVTVAFGCGTSTRSEDQPTHPLPVGPPDGGGVVGEGGPLPDGALAPGSGIEHILSTGQSNAVGFAATPPLSNTQTFGNLMFDHGVMTSADCDKDGCKRYEKPTAFAPLVEGDTYFADKVETMSSGIANEISKLRGTPGNGNEGMMQVTDAKALASAAGVKYAVRAVTAIHGESDHYGGQFPLDRTDGAPGTITNYAQALLEWQRDYDASIRAITGQTEPVPLFISQMANWNDTLHSEIPLRQLEAHVSAPGKVVVIGPTYQLPYAGDCIHFTNDGERQLGEYFGKAYQRVLSGGIWEPVRPKSVTAAGNVLTVRFQVPKPPLVLDTTLVTDPGSFGFEVADGAGAALAITKVELAGPDAVTITLAGAIATGARLRYAYTAQPQTCPGPTTGPRGNLRDSDTSPSNGNYALYNWAVQFDSAVE